MNIIYIGLQFYKNSLKCAAGVGGNFIITTLGSAIIPTSSFGKTLHFALTQTNLRESTSQNKNANVTKIYCFTMF